MNAHEVEEGVEALHEGVWVNADGGSELTDPFFEGKRSDRPGDELLRDRLRVGKAIDKKSMMRLAWRSVVRNTTFSIRLERMKFRISFRSAP